ncbi:MAG TPA: DUF4767 domain-containing protein [Aliicoccus persicus]|uniref:DUF4767 domain-containing protein n=1 Tax=Aliicoccus persicus TaxID=930138 RepID=A0A921DXB3_9STAP|nr:DUF4767 domain-containing protein [Aliicoccus persicus]
MKKKFSISMISMMVLGGSLFNMNLAEAQEEEVEDEVTEDEVVVEEEEEVEEDEVDEDVVWLDDIVRNNVSEVEFTFVGAEDATSNPNSPIATKLEGLDTDEPVVRFIWDREDESLDEVFEVNVSEVDPVEIETFNTEDEGTTTFESNIIAEFVPEDDTYYANTELYIVDGENGVELLQPNYAGNVEENQQDVYMNLVQVAQGEDGENANIEALDEAVIEWGNTLDQSYERYYPGNEEEFSHAGTDLDTMLENAVIDGTPVNLSESGNTEIVAVYSATVEEESMMRDITYIMTLIDDAPVILVTEQMEDASEIHYTGTDNTDLQAIYNDWVEQNQ